VAIGIGNTATWVTQPKFGSGMGRMSVTIYHILAKLTGVTSWCTGCFWATLFYFFSIVYYWLESNLWITIHWGPRSTMGEFRIYFRALSSEIYTLMNLLSILKLQILVLQIFLSSRTPSRLLLSDSSRNGRNLWVHYELDGSHRVFSFFVHRANNDLGYCGVVHYKQ